MSQKGFGSAIGEQRDNLKVHKVSQTADPNPFRGTHIVYYIFYIFRGGHRILAWGGGILS